MTTHEIITSEIVNHDIVDEVVTHNVTTEVVEHKMEPQQGAPGASAYQIAVSNGFIGTESEWIESLGVDKNAIMNFTNQSSVTFAHNLNKYPSVTVIDSAGDECIGDIQYDSFNQITVLFTASFTGTLICN